MQRDAVAHNGTKRIRSRDTKDEPQKRRVPGRRCHLPTYQCTLHREIEDQGPASSLPATRIHLACDQEIDAEKAARLASPEQPRPPLHRRPSSSRSRQSLAARLSEACFHREPAAAAARCGATLPPPTPNVPRLTLMAISEQSPDLRGLAYRVALWRRAGNLAARESGRFENPLMPEFGLLIQLLLFSCFARLFLAFVRGTIIRHR